MKYFFCGLGGAGMSALAVWAKALGHTVQGSDRNVAAMQTPAGQMLAHHGIEILQEKATNITAKTNVMVCSSAVEPTKPEYQKAVKLGIPVMKRADLLVQLFNGYQGVAVGGTAGKTTITAMVGHILQVTGRSPTVINGGMMLNDYGQPMPSSVLLGSSKICVAEADESDGSIVLYRPAVAVVSNISLDHHSLEKLQELFTTFVKHAKKGVVLNADCSYTKAIARGLKNCVTFSLNPKSRATFKADRIQESALGTFFTVNGQPCFLPLLGKYNVANALAAVAACSLLGVGLEESLLALQTFKGIHRRLEFVGTKGGVPVVDDFGHNPAKIQATLETLQTYAKRVWLIFQPHGFSALRMQRVALKEMFEKTLRPQDQLLLSEVYFAGGTVTKDISSQDLVHDIKPKHKAVFFFEKRADMLPVLVKQVQPGDVVAVLGARDETLSDFAHEIFHALPEHKAPVAQPMPLLYMSTNLPKTVGLILPSSPLYKPLNLPVTQKFFARLGYNVALSPAIFAHDRFCAGPDAQRAAEVNAMFTNPKIDMVMAVKGGYGSMRILDKLNYGKIKKHTKPFFGFSDTTALQMGLYAKVGYPSWSGICPGWDFLNGSVDPVMQACFDNICHHQTLSYHLQPLGAAPKKDVSGVLIGGTLSVLSALVGTPYFPDCKGKILFIEDVGEEPYKVDKYLQQLRLSGLDKQLKGLILGSFVRCISEDAEDGTVQQVLDETKTWGIPVWTCDAYGHTPARILLPVGVKGTISAKTSDLILKDI
ncbi:MAG: LD-carboxypeptidase [Alphaproteobacteria bacterium]|nr:LD-carboxypeptidase [Alphaproteobacteria bacterium]